MLTVETIGRIRRAFFVDEKPIRQIVRELRVSRKTVRKAVREAGTEFRYERQVQPQPRLGPFVARLDAMLEANAKRPRRERLTARRLFEQLRAEGYAGAYDSVQRHVREWRRARGRGSEVFIPLWFAPGEAYQFDWSHEVVVLGGVTTTVKIAHIRLLPQPNVPDPGVSARNPGDGVRGARPGVPPVRWRLSAWDLRQHADGGGRGVPRQGAPLQPTLLAALLALPGRADRLHAGGRMGEGAGREPGRQPARAVLHAAAAVRGAMPSSMLGWPTAVSPTLGRTGHPEQKGRTIFEVFEAERSSLINYPGPFDGFHEVQVTVSKSSLVHFDHNRYSVAVKAAHRTAQLRAYADRIVVWHEDEIVAEHPRRFGRGQTVYDPWHYLPVLARKPGALRNGPALSRLGLATQPGADPTPSRRSCRRRPAVRRHPGRRRRRWARGGRGGLSRGARRQALQPRCRAQPARPAATAAATGIACDTGAAGAQRGAGRRLRTLR